MPLVVLSGFPCSGKSQRAEQLRDALKAQGKDVVVVGDGSLQLQPKEAYSTATSEKLARGAIKSEVERNLSKTRTVIVDSLNYIKGYRYELYCVARSLKTSHCTIHVATMDSVCEEWHQKVGCPYGEDLFHELIQRYECPDSRNRWDKPLFTVLPEESLPIDEICGALFENRLPAPNQSTQSLPLSETNFMHELDRVTQAIVSALIKETGTAVAGDRIAVPDASELVHWKRPLPMSELRRLRRQFISYTKMHPVADSTKIGGLFVEFINNSQ